MHYLVASEVIGVLICFVNPVIFINFARVYLRACSILHR